MTPWSGSRLTIEYEKNCDNGQGNFTPHQTRRSRVRVCPLHESVETTGLSAHLSGPVCQSPILTPDAEGGPIAGSGRHFLQKPTSCF
jgi:hypothetical protein